MSQRTSPRRPAHLVLERTFSASAGATLAEVWALWTTREGFESWWGPQGYRAEVSELDARPGGVLRYAMIADAPEMVAAAQAAGQPVSHGVTARFTEVHEQARLVLTSVIDFLPGVAAYETDIVVELSVVPAGVRMVVTLEAMHSAEFSGMQAEGFASQLTKLDTRFGWAG